jgi:predicted O-linked N-acetylglucosamine transferase (SPINDLY family)
LCLGLDPKNVEILRQLAAFYQNCYQYEKGIETAKLCYSLLEELPELVFANHLMLRGLMAAGGVGKKLVPSSNGRSPCCDR